VNTTAITTGGRHIGITACFHATHALTLGGFHIEMAMWKTYGNYLEVSGWTTALTEAGIASSGTADSFLKASHLTRTRHAHQVSVLALAKLQQDAFMDMVNEEPHDEEIKSTILNMDILGLICVRADRERDVALYVESLTALVPWFFALDHHNYARWISVHIRDMESLSPSIQEELKNMVIGLFQRPPTDSRAYQ
jgi:hypothetical protein